MKCIPSPCLYSILLILALTLLHHCEADEIPSYLAKIHQLRDTVNQRRAYAQEDQKSGVKPKKPKRYKCILIEDDEEEEEGIPLSNRLDKLKAPSFVKELKITPSENPNHDEAQVDEEVSSQSFVTTQPNLPFYGAEDEMSTLYVYTPQPYEVEEPTDPPTTMPSTANPRSLSTSLNKPLRQVMLPRAHGLPLRGLMAAGEPEAVLQQPDFQAAAPPPPPAKNPSPSPIHQGEASVPRDGSNRALVLAPENCKMIEHYAGLYGVKDVKSWVHQNCSFAKMYLPTASCAEIDILVGSCNLAASA